MKFHIGINEVSFVEFVRIISTRLYSHSIFMNVPLSTHTHMKNAITHIFHLTKLSTHHIYVLEIWLVSRYNSHYTGHANQAEFGVNGWRRAALLKQYEKRMQKKASADSASQRAWMCLATSERNFGFHFIQTETKKKRRLNH